MMVARQFTAWVRTKNDPSHRDGMIGSSTASGTNGFALPILQCQN